MILRGHHLELKEHNIYEHKNSHQVIDLDKYFFRFVKNVRDDTEKRENQIDYIV